MLFLTVFCLNHGGQCNYPCFSGLLLLVFHTIFFPSHWLLSHITVVETLDSGERGMNPFAKTIINPWKEYWPSHGLNQLPPVLKSRMLPTELFIKGALALYPTVQCFNFFRRQQSLRLVQIESICRGQNKCEFGLGREENIVANGEENAGYQHFLLFSQCFQKGFFPRVDNSHNCVIMG